MRSLSALAHLTRVHCMGIGGAGMSGLARLIHASGIAVSGTDIAPSVITEALLDEGMTVAYLQDGSLLAEDVGLVVHSAAVTPRNAELALARGLGIPTVKYARMLGLIMRDFLGVAVAGTHGKTTTSSMIAHMLATAGRDPSWVIGGVPHNLGEPSHAGGGAHFVAEACEYDRSFLQLNPYLGLITNLDADHLDYYRDLSEIREAFRAFAMRLPSSGHLVVNADDEDAMWVAEEASCRVTTFSIDNPAADIHAPILDQTLGRYRFEWRYLGGIMDTVQLDVPGVQNVSNAAAMIAAGIALGVADSDIVEAAETFNGVRRRFHYRGDIGGVPVIDDYGHHPAEIEPTLRAAHEAYPDRRLWVVFQPHQAFRTRTFLAGFAEALSLADRLILAPIYAAREGGKDNDALCEEIVRRVRDRGTEAVYLQSFPRILEELRYGLDPNVVVLTLGAGNIDEIAEEAVALQAQ